MKREIKRIEITEHELKALLFWATVGVSKSYSGSYRDIEDIIDTLAEYVQFKGNLSTKPKFMNHQ